MECLNSKPKGLGAWRFLLALLCISLVIVGGTVQAVHVHPQGDITHADCALCATAHVSVQVAASPAVLYFAPVVSYVETLFAPAASRSFVTFALFTRPPPVDLVLA